MGTTFPVSIQDKEINALLDTGAEKSCMSTDMLVHITFQYLTGAHKNGCKFKSKHKFLEIRYP